MPLHQLPINFTDLLKSAVLRTIFHAIENSRDNRMSALFGWDSFHYLINNFSGDVGIISFYPDSILIAAFFDHESSRNPYGEDAEYDWKKYLAAAPDEIVSRAKLVTLQYMLDSINGSEVPLITTLFWGNTHGLESNDTWEEILRHSGNLIEYRHELDYTLWFEYQNDYEFDSREMAAAVQLWNLKKDHISTRIDVDLETSYLNRFTQRPGFNEMIETLKQVGIHVT